MLQADMRFKTYILALQDSPGCKRRAQALARELDLPRAKEPLQEEGSFLLVREDALGLALNRDDTRSRQAFWPSLGDLDISSRAGRSSKQPLLKAVLGRWGRASAPLVLDATAGLGRDAWLLAAHRARVLALERSAAVFALLRDCLARAGIRSQATAKRVVPLHQEALDFLQQPEQNFRQRPEVVYLDPLFGAQNRRAAPWKGMQVLQGLLAGQDPQQEELLRAALQLATRRVVFKRPAKGKVIEIQGARPSLQVRAKALRFDVYLRQG